MELAPADDTARQSLVNSLFEVDGQTGVINRKTAEYVAKTFPSILLDIARLLVEQATTHAKKGDNQDPASNIRYQLRPYLMFNLLLGKAPQATSLMYSYFEQSSFQPLPENLFKWDTDEERIVYLLPGFTDNLVQDILIAYFKYLSFNPKWFSAIWNWSELGRFIALHTNHNIRYIATCCLSIITKPERFQHVSLVRETIGIDEYSLMIDTQIKHRDLFDNTFKPLIETKHERAHEYCRSIGYSRTGYSYDKESLTKVANVLLLKRELVHPRSNPSHDYISALKTRIQEAIDKFVPVPTLQDTISRIAYSVSINKPCLIRGPSGSGKTAVLDYIAARTQRLNPPEYIKVQIGDQIDSKLLIGSYVCTEIPGQFEWQPGPLARAMAYGSWIVFEDIDTAPSDLAQVIHSVIENGSLSCISSCPLKLDNPHPDFRIFFTQRTYKSASRAAVDTLSLGFGFVERLCDIVNMPDLQDDEYDVVIRTRYKLGILTGTVMRLYRSAESMLAAAANTVKVKLITSRDLFKFCDRIASLKLDTASQTFSTSDLDLIFLDAVDCFLGSLTQESYKLAADELAKILNKSSSGAEDDLFRRNLDAIEGQGVFKVGRVILPQAQNSKPVSRSVVAYTRQALTLMECVSRCIVQREPVLLVGETGVGKTTIVQHIANATKNDLIVVNLSQQSDSSDLLGGYKPVEMREIMTPIHEKFVDLMKKTWDSEANEPFLGHVEDLYTKGRQGSSWITYLRLLHTLCDRSLGMELTNSQSLMWTALRNKVKLLSNRVASESTSSSSSMALAFSKGSLLTAIEEGKWILLDEVNLAEPEVLQCLLLILDSIKDSQVYINTENCDVVKIHTNFRMFACMNPSTDVGKKELPQGIRGRFTEFFVDDVVSKRDLRMIVESYVKTCFQPKLIESIVNFYLETRTQAQTVSDISGNSPVYSLRTLCRALTMCSANICHNAEKSLIESLKTTFFQQLSFESVKRVMELIYTHLLNKKELERLEKQSIPKPNDGHDYINVEDFWIRAGREAPLVDDKYILTDSVRANLKNLSRIICLSQRRLPILIQGKTSVGKTSLVTYLAKLTGNKCYRINNHEHTDLQEYVGRYVLKENGDLTFQEGLLVRAMKKGYWLILDELNLAPCELLEALNRVLDDNRELFIPETRQTIKAHSNFVIFATQNPPEEYAGRKALSRAFRNRFIELHFDDIPHGELETILRMRCQMAPQYAKKIVIVMKELQKIRRESGCFNGKYGFMTMRDLFRWGERYLRFKNDFPDDQFLDWDQHIAEEGLILLEGRVRTINEADIVKGIIEKTFVRKLERPEVYKHAKEVLDSLVEYKHIHFTPEFQRLFVQLRRALMYNEPVLLCGQTGCGKTTACQLYAAMRKQNLITYNCHLNTESSDFIGDVRPQRRSSSSGNSSGRQIFAWSNGPLLEAMMNGAVFLMDEISLSDDAVLERINSVLEPERSITLSERDGQEIYAHKDFRFVATMNPGGDYGKKELSIALRNRFTEIYCHNTTDISQIGMIIGKSLYPALLKPHIVPKLISTMEIFLSQYYANHDIVSLRDILSWTKFINLTTQISQLKPLSLQEALIDGASLVFFDQFGSSGHRLATAQLPSELKRQLDAMLRTITANKFGTDPKYVDRIPDKIDPRPNLVTFDRFSITKGPYTTSQNTKQEFIFDAPTVKANMIKIVRAMQLDRPILLEGDPGAGKTSIVRALANLSGHKLTRINLSEQTDISDLFGSDLPDISDPNNGAPKFSWHDGPLLKAIKHSRWVLLDEMNLASQSVLEGLNACLDHRGEIFIPELGKRFPVDRSTTRIFACQNPATQGASRKGLPQSFLNRFTTIYIEAHSDMDSLVILRNLYPMMSEAMIKNMIQFNSLVCKTFSGFDYEFNLRDLIYWCDLTTKYVQGNQPKKFGLIRPDKYVQFVYSDRMRSSSSRNKLNDLFEKVFGVPIHEPPYRDIRLGEYSFIMGRTILPRRIRLPPHLANMCLLKYQMPYLESLAKAIESNKMPILVGETGVGKHSIVKILAGLTGNELSIIGANREMDTVELLGSYEQQSLQREMVELIEQCKSCVTDMINSISQKRNASTWTQLFKHSWSAIFSATVRDLNLSKDEMLDAYRFQLIQLKDLIENIHPLCSTKMEKKCGLLKAKIDRIMDRFLHDAEAMYSTGNFEWVDSLLVRSVRNGNWLMIENANLLNPATLDRLNSLVEPEGTLCLNEKGSGANGLEVLTPHPEFRLILTMDPSYGELSRAMRNRGVEIFVQTRFFFEDYLMLLNQNGFEPEEQKACMAYCIMQTSYDVHEKITGSEPMKDEEGSPLAHFGLNYISTLTHQVRRGMDVDRTLSSLLTSFYHQRGFLESSNDESIYSFVSTQMNNYRKTYEVNLVDERYKWFNLRHDLVSMSGGDTIAVMVNRDNKIFFEDLPVELLFKPDEMIENIDIVNTCIAVKIFLELSTHGDFEYRKGFIRETFQLFKNMMIIVNNHVDLLYSEYIPLINNMLSKHSNPPPSEMHIDTRNSPDVHHCLQTMDFDATQQLELQQNRWLLSLHRIMLCMIVELVEERSLSTSEPRVSLWTLSEEVRTGKRLKEDLIRPAAEIASDLYDLLNGIMRVVSNRCIDNVVLIRMMPRFFWISYFICKIKRAHRNDELIALCNQLPMLWALTVQKVVEPMDKECNLWDLTYKNKKFSNRIQHISDFLDIAPSKPCKNEKIFYKKVINLHATTTKLRETYARDVDNFFNRMLGKYNSKIYNQVEGLQVEILSSSNMLWSNSYYMSQLYTITERLLALDTEDSNSRQALEATVILGNLKDHYSQQDELDARARVGSLSSKKLTPASDQFSPVWQLAFLRLRQSQFNTEDETIAKYRYKLIAALKNVNGLLMSPKYYGTIAKCLWKLEQRQCEDSLDNDEIEGASSPRQAARQKDRDNLDVYSTFLVDHVLENIVLDNQVVNWTKLRVTTSDLSSVAPLVPEYAPILSLVGSYCLDISHLKLNSHRNNSPHLDSLIVYLWRSYKQIKHNSSRDAMDINLARNLIHYRSRIGDLKEEAVGQHDCQFDHQCKCIEVFLRKRASMYDQMIRGLQENVEHPEDLASFIKSINLIYFGYYSMFEFAPIFNWDPALRSREKLEVYKSELAHIKLDLHARNTLFYWKTGENLKLNEVDTEDASLYPFSTYVLIERRVKLEKSIAKLRQHHTTRPKSDDGSVYYDLRKEVHVSLGRYRENVETLIKEFLEYINSKGSVKHAKLSNLTTKCRMLIRSLEKTILQFRSEYALYGDLLTHFLTGLCFLLQGLRRLYSRLEQKMQIIELGFLCSINRFATDIIGLFSFSNVHQCNLESVHFKLNMIPVLGKICPPDRVNYIQSILLQSALMQLNHHIMLTPSDIPVCIKIVRDITILFQAAWLRRKLYLEEQKRKKEELYRYKPVKTALGQEVSYEQQEFIDICTKFPVYDHIFQSFFVVPAMSVEKENIDTEAKIINLSRSVDLSVCIDICKSHYKFIKTASRTLLGYRHESDSTVTEFPVNELDQLVRLEAEALYTILRQCNSHFDQTFDAMSIECHLLQALNLSKILRQTSPKLTQVGTTKSSIEILDEDVFDIYHDSNTYEALKLQEFMSKLEAKVHQIRLISGKSYENDSVLNNLVEIIKRISSFLITDPLMKFITGGHTLLEKIDEWNRQSIPKQDKMHAEAANLFDLLDSWRQLELETWKSSLHRVRRKYTHDTLCDHWFKLYEAFNDPVICARDHIRKEHSEPDFIFTPETEMGLYIGFSEYVKKFLEQSTLGDYQIRLDLVSSFVIQTRFASLYDQAKPDYNKNLTDEEKLIQVDFDKLTTYVYNTLRQYQGLFESFRHKQEELDKIHHAKLNEKIKIFAWRGRNFSEVKKQRRNSHRILNSVMNDYLDLLKQDLAALKIVSYTLDMNDIMSCDLRQAKTFEKAGSCINSIELSSTEPKLSAVRNASNIVEKCRALFNGVYHSFSDKAIENFKSIEQTIQDNASYIENYSSHQVEKVLIQPSDSKEVQADKQKQSRQMRHSRRFALQAVFKNLQNAGISYQRGLNNDDLDQSVSEMEPLRGLMQHQTRDVLRSASDLIDNALISKCNDMLLRLSANNMLLLAQANNSDLSSDHFQRIQGYATDMIANIIKNNQNAAIIYKNFMNIQAASMRLKELLKNYGDKGIVIYNYDRVHGSLQLFNKLVSRAYSAIFKLDKLLECQDTVVSLDCSTAEVVASDPNAAQDAEKQALLDLIHEIDPSNSLITREQSAYIGRNLAETRRCIAEISDELRDKLKLTKQNHIYSDDDIDNLKTLYEKFAKSYRNLLPNDLKHNDGTLLGSMCSILVEAEKRLMPQLERAYLTGSAGHIDVTDHPNLTRLNLRLRKLIREIKVASQSIAEDAWELNEESQNPMSETAKRRLKPFNQIDSTRLRILLRQGKVAEYLEKCFMTLNLAEASTDISQLATGLSPILTIYTQNLACYLNIIINSLYLKLSLANQLVPFFMELITKGFGLPSKLDSSEADNSSKQNANMNEDNAGFGEGQGEVDASKKLEYESQLDDLKKNGQDENGMQGNDKGAEDDVEAHDDAVEMTDDIDAKAQGPDEADENQSDPDIEDDEPIDEEELDKQMDTVDDDNKTLDKAFWGDDDGEVSNEEQEDDEQDLRESNDKSAMPDPGQLDMNSQTDAQAAPSSDLERDRKEEGNAAEKQDTEGPTDMELESMNESVEMADDTETKEDTLENEADQSEQGGAQDETTEDESTRQLEITLGGTDDGSSNSGDDASQLPDDNADADLQEPTDKSAGPEQADQGDEGIDTCPTANAQKQPKSSEKDDQIEVDGTSEVINIGDSDENQSQAASQVGPLDPATTAQDKERQPEPVDDKSCKRTLARRSLDEKDINEIKRQKIEPALKELDENEAQNRDEGLNREADKKESDADAKGQNDNESKMESAAGAQEYRHLTSDKADAIEVVDLADDSEDDVLLEGDADKIAQESANNLVSRVDDREISFSPISDSSEIAESETFHSLDKSHDKSNTYNTNVGLLKYISAFNNSVGGDNGLTAGGDKESGADADTTKELIDSIDKELSKNSAGQLDSVDADKLTRLWQSCTRSNSHLVHELCQQLQIVLQPTKMSKYKGDYKTGKRLNMRKIISYIASHYRKDKIWLRRTKPSKRAYNIALAIDNSSSMSDNNCRQMTYQSLALLAKSLSIIEAGSLSVLSFGEQVKCIHEFGSPYMDAIGSQWLSELRFNESRTCYSKLLKHSCEAFAKQAQLTASRLDTQTSISQLLLIISDGRNITKELEEIKGYLKQLKQMGVLTLFIIVDDLSRNDGKSIADIMACISTADGPQVESYLSIFPFPFYILLRHMDTMPSILGEALRQWFELVSSYA